MAHARHQWHRDGRPWLLLVIVVAALCVPGVAGAQPPVFGALVKPKGVVEGRYEQYLRLLERYRIEDDTWMRDLRDFWTTANNDEREIIPYLLKNQPAGLAPLAEMALTDLALELFSRNDKKLANADLQMAEQFIDATLKRPSGGGDLAAVRERQLRFARDWYRAMIWLRIRRFEPKESAGLLVRARARFPDDPDVLLSSGTHEELELKRLRTEFHNPTPQNRKRQQMLDVSRPTDDAVNYYRRAIALDPNAAEARIRLAYVLMSMGNRQREEALTLLKEATALASKPPLSYLAALFAGAIEEQRKQLPAAGFWYRTAIAACPRAQTARLAYSHLQLDQDDNMRAAQNTLRPLSGAPPSPDEICEPDPWRLYEFGPAWRLNALIAAMRKQVREPVEKSEP